MSGIWFAKRIDPHEQRISIRQCANCRSGYAANFHALRSAMLSRRDSNSRQRHIQTCGQKSPQRFIGAIIHWRRSQPNFESFLPNSHNFVAARPRLDSHGKTHRSLFFHDLHALAPSFLARFDDGHEVKNTHRHSELDQSKGE
jgi:hypothetical protein